MCLPFEVVQCRWSEMTKFYPFYDWMIFHIYTSHDGHIYWLLWIVVQLTRRGSCFFRMPISFHIYPSKFSIVLFLICGNFSYVLSHSGCAAVRIYSQCIRIPFNLSISEYWSRVIRQKQESFWKKRNFRKFILK